MSVFFAIQKGPYDALLGWPFVCPVTITLLDQSASREHRPPNDIARTFTPNPRPENEPFLGRPVENRNICLGENQIFNLSLSSGWRRQLWGTGARSPNPPRLPTISFLVHFGVNLTVSHPNIARYLVQMSKNHSSFDQYCINYETISHRAAAVPSPEVCVVNE